ncbi:MAG: glycosyltransferase [Oscillospiraceae bacterium]|nr:glycosyltransferase [Oscillospiraceae bacterium]
MLVSIITVCYNSAATIRKAIESVLNQTYPNIEYTIVDGLSKDNTVEIARSYEAAFREKGYSFRVISEKDQGIYDAMNKGIRMASGTLVGMINSDDWYEPIAVETAANAYQEDPYDVFYGDINLIRSNGQIIVKRSRLDRFPSSRHWNHPTTFITKKAYDQVGLYKNEAIYDDFDLILRMRRAGKRIAIRNVVLANFKTGGVSNEKSLKKCFKRIRIRYKNYRNNGYSPLYIFESIAMEVAKLILS